MTYWPRHQHCFGCLTLPSPSSSAAPSLLVCTCPAGIHTQRLTLIRKKEKSFQFQPKNFQNHTFKAAKISETHSYPSPVTSECPESKTYYQPPQFQLFHLFPGTDFPLGETALLCHSWNITYKEPSFMRWKICNCWNASPSTFSPWEDCLVPLQILF